MSNHYNQANIVGRQSTGLPSLYQTRRPSSAQWDPTIAVGLWWKDKTQRTETNISGPRKHKVDESTQLQLTESDKFDFSLSDWDDWLESSDSCESDRL